MLLEHPGEVVLRDDLRRRLWASDTWTDFDHGLNKAVNKLRETLGDSADNPRFIETLAKRGYRFVAPVQIGGDAPEVPAEAAPLQQHSPSSPSGSRVWLAYAGIGLAIAALIALAGVGTWNAMRPTTPTARTMLAVLPFADIPGDLEDDYLGDGVTEEIILQVGRMSPSRLGVIARTSAMHYKGSRKRIDDIGRELSVHYVLEGTVRRSDRRVRISARLIRTADQTPLWAESYERDLEDVFEIQSDVARRIASSLAIELLPASASPSDSIPKATTEAYEAYLKGRYYWNRRTPVDLERAVTLLEDAVAKDPKYAPAWAALADALNVLPWYGLRPPREAYPASKDAARRALRLDETSAAAHTALAYAHHYYDWSWTDAEREYQRALALNPNYAQAHQWLAAHYAELGRTDDALREMELARRLDPHALIVQAGIGWINYLGRRFGPATAQLRSTLEIDPDFVPALLWLAQALESAGRPDEAIEPARRVRTLSGVAPTGLGELARAYAAAGRADEARHALTELLGLARGRYVEPDIVARVYAALGEDDRALEWLERGFDERAVKMVLIGVDPQFDRLRGNARFQALLRRLNLPDQSSP
jgi:TolB-like protein/Tfp pilus assembly protein PilF